ncbi:hypothetical protein ANN_01218 [Periplaneta americana]|uniref:Uncharacterized protein n=1 Tax=Periplaneta americana TaxID=6978 RepID=A0ABQ8TUR4_PERAM|nr:hypothetical protein ANN_01218 [Periplaneta americana]
MGSGPVRSEARCSTCQHRIHECHAGQLLDNHRIYCICRVHKGLMTLTLREEQRLRVFENKVLRKMFGAKRDEVTGEWRKLHNAELHALYSSPDIIHNRNIKSRRLRWAEHVARMGESRNAYRVLVVRPEVKRPLGRPRLRWEDNIKMDLREVGYDGSCAQSGLHRKVGYRCNTDPTTSERTKVDYPVIALILPGCFSRRAPDKPEGLEFHALPIPGLDNLNTNNDKKLFPDPCKALTDVYVSTLATSVTQSERASIPFRQSGFDLGRVVIELWWTK